jgi:uncharacterized protein
MLAGLSENTIKNTIQALRLFPEIEKASIYGSRAKGTYSNGSDIDIALYGKEISDKILLEIKVFLNERTPLPYSFDITYYNKIKSEELKEEIDNCSIPFYSKHNEL